MVVLLFLLILKTVLVLQVLVVVKPHPRKQVNVEVPVDADPFKEAQRLVSNHHTVRESQSVCSSCTRIDLCNSTHHDH